jgi:copper chaperone
MNAIEPGLPGPTRLLGLRDISGGSPGCSCCTGKADTEGGDIRRQTAHNLPSATGVTVTTTTATTIKEDRLMTTTITYRVTGMTCGHCVSAVQEELLVLDGVEDVAVELHVGGVSNVRVTSAQPLSDERVAAALDEAGDYALDPSVPAS